MSTKSAANSWKYADAYLFDIDGTLLVTRDLVHWNALHEAMLQTWGVDATIEGIPYHGMTDLGILRAAMYRSGISPQDFDSKLPAALQVVCSEVAKNAAGIRADVCPAIPDVLEHLSRRGKLLAVASGNLESVGWSKLEATGLRRYFQFGSFSDQRESRTAIFRHAAEQVRRRLGPNARACFIGDTPSDVRAARESDAAIISVATGTFSQSDLAGNNPDVCVSCCADLLPLFD